MAGPFTSYAQPDVYTRTIYDPAVASLLGGLRIPVLIGPAEEFICVDDLEIFRGSSSTNDNPVVNEDITRFFDGSNFGPAKVRYFPIVRGDGSGTLTNNPLDVQVTINGEPVAVRQVRGDVGEIFLVDIPRGDGEDIVRISYFFNRTDTLIQEEDLSFQVDGSRKLFKVKNIPIVLGNNGGVATTDVTRITVTVDGDSIIPISLDGASGYFQLASPPDAGAELLVTYYTNTWQDTFDLLPNEGITFVERVGLGPGRTDFVEGVDYVVVDDRIHWGASYRIEAKKHTFGFEYFDDTQVSFTLKDNKRFMELIGIGDGIDKEFFTKFPMTDGSGRDQIIGDVDIFVDIETDDVGKVTAYVGPSVEAALIAGPVVVLEVQGKERRVLLKNAPPAGEFVYLTHYENLLRDDCYEIVVKYGAPNSIATSDPNLFPNTGSSKWNAKPSSQKYDSGTGTYQVISNKFGIVPTVREIVGDHSVTDVAFLTTGIVWPDGQNFGASDLQTAVGASVEEDVTVTFDMGDGKKFTVTSNDPINGSSGTGNVGQTYVDNRTGLRFTIMDSDTHPDAFYLFAPGDFLKFYIDFEEVGVGAVPNLQVPGGWLIVQSTVNTAVGDSAELCTFDKAGREPAIGDFYYISYCYAKTDYNTHIYTRFKDIERDFGPLVPGNRLVVAAWLAMLNGATALALKQVKKEPLVIPFTRGGGTRQEFLGGPILTHTQAPPQAYISAFQELEKPIEGKIKPDVIVPLTTDEEVLENLLFHVTKMSNIRFQGERIGVYGLPVGTKPFRAQEIAKSIHSNRMVQMYPDGAIMGLLDELGFEVQFQVDGSFLAAAFAGLNVSPQFDVATPMTNKQIVGFKRLNRIMDMTEMNQTAAAGVTIIEDQDPVMIVRHSLTTDMTNVLTRELSITTIADYVQQVARHNLRQYIGRKYLNRVNRDIEATLAASLELLRSAEIITAFRGVVSETDQVDPTIARVTAFYRPVFPLNWIVVTFHLRTVL